MTIPSFKILKKNAAERVAAAEHSRKLVLIYAGTVTILSALVTVINYCLDLQIAQTGGLSNMGLRSVLSTIQSVLPMLQSMVAMCLELGYIAAMVRISRQQYASPQTLRLGFERFWTMLRYSLMQGGIYMLAAMASFWVAIQIYLLTPLSNALMGIITADMADPNVLMEYLQDPAFSAQISGAMVPFLLMFALVYALVCLPIGYSLRMAKYVIIDKPGRGAFFAIRESRKMMKGSRFRLFKLDLSLWWWFALSFFCAALAYGDSLLALVGIALPISADAGYFLFYGLFLVTQCALSICLRNRVEVVYAQAYNALKPRETDNGVVLGNIFQM